MKKIIQFILTLIIIFNIQINSQSIPTTINYQGILKDASGVVVSDGDYNITFKLYNTASGGTALWTETKTINVNEGIVNTLLGSITPLTLPFDAAYWLSITIGAGTELTPRVELSSVPYSYMSMSVPNGTLTAEKIAGGQVVKSINSLKDNINLVAGSNVTITPSGNNLTISSTGGTGLTLPFEGTLNTPSTTALYLVHTATTGSNYGVYSSINSSSGMAIYGIAPAYGIQGYATNTSGIADGVRGISSSSSGTGVFGAVTSTSGTNYGGYFQSSGSSGTGIYGENLSTTGSNTYGVRGKSNATGGVISAGVRGDGTYAGALFVGSDKYGVAGSALGSSYSYGVYGSGNPGTNNYAGYFQGNVNVTGTLSKGGGSFKIDHPLDPQNKYLYHSFVESPDMKNIYDGTVILDNNGEAIVQLPEWFEALNKDFRYQLTAIGAPGPNLYIASEVNNNQMKIAGGESGMKVSWQVTGIRKDAFAEKYRIPVEEEKQIEEKGKYAHPEAFGLPKSLGIDQNHFGNLVQTQEEVRTDIIDRTNDIERDINNDPTQINFELPKINKLETEIRN